MNISNNTILITGGTSGIGLALANAFHLAGNRVIIGGRDEDKLKKTREEHPELEIVALDLASNHSIREAARQVAASYPGLSVLINNGGIQIAENLLDDPLDLSSMESEISVNLVGQIRLITALLPLLRKQSSSTIINVTSGLAFVPMNAVPTYCATKAAMHSYTMSLRYQLRATATQVIELIPPQVQTNLRPGYAQDPRAMPLADFVSEVMEILTSEPKVSEVVVERCKPIRFASERGTFDGMFSVLNERS